MFAGSNYDPTGRFTDVADAYARARPDYPAEALDWLVASCGLVPGSKVADVGCGTGIFTRQLAARGLAVTGVEPNAPMLAKAGAVPPPTHALPPRYVAGTAEATGLPDAGFDAVTAAQAFHWFDPEPALREFRRLLRPGGWVVLIWNLPEVADPVAAGFVEALREFSPEPEVVGPDKYRRAGAVLLGHPDFDPTDLRDFPHGQALDEDGFLARAFSASFAPKEPAAAASCAERLRGLFARHQSGGRVTLPYTTAVYRARPRGGSYTAVV